MRGLRILTRLGQDTEWLGNEVGDGTNRQESWQLKDWASAQDVLSSLVWYGQARVQDIHWTGLAHGNLSDP